MKCVSSVFIFVFGSTCSNPAMHKNAGIASHDKSGVSGPASVSFTFRGIVVLPKQSMRVISSRFSTAMLPSMGCATARMYPHTDMSVARLCGVSSSWSTSRSECLGIEVRADASEPLAEADASGFASSFISQRCLIGSGSPLSAVFGVIRVFSIR